MEKHICCICKKEFEGYGNNPYGAIWLNANNEIERPKFNENDRCCDECNWRYVVVGRLYDVTHKDSEKDNDVNEIGIELDVP